MADRRLLELAHEVLALILQPPPGPIGPVGMFDGLRLEGKATDLARAALAEVAAREAAEARATREAQLADALAEVLDDGEWHSSRDCRTEKRDGDCNHCKALAQHAAARRGETT